MAITATYLLQSVMAHFNDGGQHPVVEHLGNRCDEDPIPTAKRFVSKVSIFFDRYLYGTHGFPFYRLYPFSGLGTIGEMAAYDATESLRGQSVTSSVRPD